MSSTNQASGSSPIFEVSVAWLSSNHPTLTRSSRTDSPDLLRSTDRIYRAATLTLAARLAQKQRAQAAPLHLPQNGEVIKESRKAVERVALVSRGLLLRTTRERFRLRQRSELEFLCIVQSLKFRRGSNATKQEMRIGSPFRIVFIFKYQSFRANIINLQFKNAVAHEFPIINAIDLCLGLNDRFADHRNVTAKQ